MPSVLTHPLGSCRFANLVRMVARYGCDPAYLPRLLGVGLQSALRQPVFWLEFLRHGAEIRSTAIAPDPVFVIGHWRSGTTHLQNLLAQDPQFATVTLQQAAMPLDFLTLGNLMSGPFAGALPRKRLMDNVAVAASSPWEEELALAATSPLSFYHVSFFPKGIRRIFRDAVLFDGGNPKLAGRWTQDCLAFLKKVQSASPGKHLMLKNPANTARIRLLTTLFPDARFIHIHRDPYKVFASTVHLYLKAQEEWGFHRVDREAVVDHVLDSYPLLMNAYIDQRNRIPEGRLCEVRFSDLQQSPLETLGTVYRQLDISGLETATPHFRSYLESVSDYRKNRLELSARDKARVKERWEPFFHHFGYSV